MRQIPGWSAWETYVNEKLGLEATVASGSQFYDKGDGVDRGQGDWAFQVDAKYTDKLSFPVNRRVLDQYVMRASMAGKRFVLAVRCWGRGHHQPSDFAVIPFELFLAMLERIREAENA